MKVPFRQQVSDYDCVPTSLINALCNLFDRKDILPFVVHRMAIGSEVNTPSP